MRHRARRGSVFDGFSGKTRVIDRLFCSLDELCDAPQNTDQPDENHTMVHPKRMVEARYHLFGQLHGSTKKETESGDQCGERVLGEATHRSTYDMTHGSAHGNLTSAAAQSRSTCPGPSRS